MLGSAFVKLATGHFSGLGRDLENDRPDRPTPSETIKNLIIEDSLGKEVEIPTDKTIKITIKSGQYIESLFTDLYFGKVRIDQQRETLRQLLDCQSHPAWVLVTAYYASFFMAIELSKIAGRFMTNIDDLSLQHLMQQSLNSQTIADIEKYNSFAVRAKPGDLTGETILELRKHSPRPHVIAWENFRSLFASIDNTQKSIILLTAILRENSGWAIPSEIRNSWNYSNPAYFGGYGSEMGKEFISVIKDSSSAFKWAGRNKLSASEENKATSIGFLYHVLSSTYDHVISSFEIA